MKKVVIFFSSLLVAAVFVANAQDRSGRLYYKISAEAGYINFVQGNATLENELSEVKSLSEVEKVNAGERVKTSANSRVEILLNPGSYLRLHDNSEVMFLDTSFDNMRVSVLRGIALFEVITTKEFSIKVITPKFQAELVKSGIYRIEVGNDGNAILQVRNGLAVVGSTEVNKGKQIAINSNGKIFIEKFDRDNKDEFDQWSKDRAKSLAKINSKLESKTLRDSLLGYSDKLNWYTSLGLWVYHPGFGYCFLPFGYGWSSPYGFWLPYDIWRLNTPVMPWQQNIPRNTPGTGNAPGNNTPAGNPSKPREDTPPIIEPPFLRVQKEMKEVPMTGRSTAFPAERWPRSMNDVPVNPAPMPVNNSPSIVETTPTVPMPARRKGRDDK